MDTLYTYGITYRTLSGTTAIAYVIAESESSARDVFYRGHDGRIIVIERF